MPGPDGAPGEKGETVSLASEHIIVYFLNAMALYITLSCAAIPPFTQKLISGLSIIIIGKL